MTPSSFTWVCVCDLKCQNHFIVCCKLFSIVKGVRRSKEISQKKVIKRALDDFINCNNFMFRCPHVSLSLGSWTSSFLSITQLHFISDDMTTFTSKSSRAMQCVEMSKIRVFFNWIAPSVMCELIWCPLSLFHLLYFLNFQLNYFSRFYTK